MLPIKSAASEGDSAAASSLQLEPPEVCGTCEKLAESAGFGQGPCPQCGRTALLDWATLANPDSELQAAA
eukprot:8345518-Pyramimonas_sp.AAC.1